MSDVEEQASPAHQDQESGFTEEEQASTTEKEEEEEEEEEPTATSQDIVEPRPESKSSQVERKGHHELNWIVMFKAVLKYRYCLD